MEIIITLFVIIGLFFWLFPKVPLEQLLKERAELTEIYRFNTNILNRQFEEMDIIKLKFQNNEITQEEYNSHVFAHNKIITEIRNKIDNNLNKLDTYHRVIQTHKDF